MAKLLKRRILVYKKIVQLLLIGSLLNVPGICKAQMTDAEMEQAVSQTKTISNFDKYLKQIDEQVVSPEDLAAIYLVLQNTFEVAIHQQRGATENKVFIHEDGHSEAVYDGNGEIVQDGINDPSYNYFNNKEFPLRHYLYDINPWIIWGNTQTDSTDVKERIYAYMGDLEGGIRRAHNLREQLKEIKASNWADEDQRVALSIFLKALDLGAVTGFFELVHSDSSIEVDKLIEVLRGIDEGLGSVYGTK